MQYSSYYLNTTQNSRLKKFNMKISEECEKIRNQKSKMYALLMMSLMIVIM